ncbi:hypothetical protein FRC07_000084 [Ceratobasidium sp. 392]|nr:hypothetical protein FRC07_000084 [Ceratobasidium sp. 392]
MPIPAHIQERLNHPMSPDEVDEHSNDTVSGSMVSVLSNDPVLAASQVTPGADSWYVTRVLGPILKRAKPDDERDARDVTPWHLIPKVLDALARMELTRLHVVGEATRALELNEKMRKEKKTSQEEDDNVLLPSDKKKELRSLVHSKQCAVLRENYMYISLQTRIIHTHEDIRARAAGVDNLILTYFPQNLTAPDSHLFIHSMKKASADELKDYSEARMSVYTLYRNVDKWEDELKESISESVMNGLPQDANLKFSYPEEFDKKFQPAVSWIKVLKLIAGWNKTVQNMVNTLEKIFQES